MILLSHINLPTEKNATKLWNWGIPDHNTLFSYYSVFYSLCRKCCYWFSSLAHWLDIHHRKRSGFIWSELSECVMMILVYVVSTIYAACTMQMNCCYLLFPPIRTNKMKMKPLLSQFPLMHIFTKEILFIYSFHVAGRIFLRHSCIYFFFCLSYFSLLFSLKTRKSSPFNHMYLAFLPTHKERRIRSRYVLANWRIGALLHGEVWSYDLFC